MNSFEDLFVYQKSIDFVKSVYNATEQFPKTETFGLCDQLKRAVVSIPSNIAEGFDRKTSKEFHQFLQISYGSSSEVATQLSIALKLNFISRKQHTKLNTDLIVIRKMLHKLIIAIKSKYPH